MGIKTKTIVLPTAVLIGIFFVMGGILFSVLMRHADETHDDEMIRQMLMEGRQMTIELEILLSTLGPADALRGLEANDPNQAQSLMKDLRPLGLTDMIITGLNKKPLFPQGGALPKGLDEVLTKTPIQIGKAQFVVVDTLLVAYGPIFHTKAHRGYLIFVAQIPAGLQDLITRLKPLIRDFTREETSISKRLISSHDEAEIRGSTLIRQTMLVMGSVLVVGLLVIILVQRGVTLGILKPLQRIMQAVNGISKGNLMERVQISSNRDEIDEMAIHINEMVEGLAKTVGLVRLQSETASAISTALSGSSENLSRDSALIEEMAHKTVAENDRVDSETRALVTLIEQTSNNISGVRSGVEQLSNNIRSVASEGENASGNVNSVASAAEQMSANIEGVNCNLTQVQENVHTVSNFIQELTHSFDGVRQRCEHANNETSSAMRMVQENNDIMTKLVASALEIGKVVEIINSIAEQTNMLSLNAAIEAAGAGSVGAGFAVVAGEVKDLARQTAAATSGISRMVDEIQLHSRSAMEAVQGVTGGFDRINASNWEISVAVNEQSRMVTQISTSMEGLKSAADEVTRNAKEIGVASQEVSRSAFEAAQSTNKIAQLVTQAAGAAGELAVDGQEAHERVVKVLESGQGILFSSAEVQKRGVQTLDRIRYMNGWIGQSIMLTEVIQNTSQSMDSAVKGLIISQPPFDVQKVKYLHLKWLANLSQDIRGGVQMNEQEVSSHFECAFGKWFHSEGKTLFGDTTVFKELGVVHEEIHRVGQEAHVLARQTQMEAAFEKYALLNEVRSRLFVKLDELYLLASTTQTTG
ncbi:MAG: CZB domain-containing protein [Magnetococcales bacterium]|nr:CZB domain-containing protein [Magnetococcales bacterium]